MRRLKKNLFFLLTFAWLGSFQALSAQSSTVTTIAGGGPVSYIGNGGPATLANLGGPDDIAFDSQGNLYIADPGYLLVRKIDMTTGIITTVAGDGTFNPGYSGDGGPATLASFYYPSGIAFDSQDNLYISDFYNNVVRKVDHLTGIITTVVGTGAGTFTGDGGPATLATLQNPLRLLFDASDNLYIADSNNNAIRRVDRATGIITTVAGISGDAAPGYSGDGGLATSAMLRVPQGMDFDSFGNILFTDSDNHVVRKINMTTGIITTIAGKGPPAPSGFSGDGGPASSAVFSDEPDDILVGCNNNIYITDDFNQVIRKIDGTTGIMTTFAGTVTVSGGVTVGVAGYQDGPPLSAMFSHPEAIVFDKQGNMIVADYDLGYIRKISLACLLTPTPTATATNTPANTATITPTSTPTDTPTLSPTPTPSPTPTNSPTVTPTNSPTNSPTITPTPSPSNSPTPTPTVTPSSTPTHSPTVTPSSTPTNSATLTPSSTPTSTPTQTPTPTWDIQMGKQASQSTVASGDHLTYSLGVTVLGNQVYGVILTDLLPAGLTFSGFGTPGAGSATFNTAVSLIQWTLPSPLSPGIYTLTYSAAVNPLLAGGTEIVNSAKLNCIGLALPLDASVTVKVTGNVTVRVGVYNEAGELIRQLILKQYSQPIDSITLSNNTISRLSGANDHIDITHDGILLGTWDGRDSDGHPVTNGVYHIKLDNVDSFGVVTTVTQQAVVSRSLAKVTVSVYNEAGEVVKHLYSLVDDSNGNQMTDVILNGTVLQPGAQGPQSHLGIEIQSSGSPVTLTWDGTSDSGAQVTNGQYLLAVRWADGQGGTVDMTRSVMVTSGQAAGNESLTAQPNLLRIALGQKVVTFKSGPSGSFTLKAGIYTLDGELIGQFEGAPGTNQVVWDAGGAASGMYLAAVEEINTDGLVKNRKILKILVVR